MDLVIKMRLDKFLSEYNFIKSRTKAKKIIESKCVSINNHIICDSDYEISIVDFNKNKINISIQEDDTQKYVSRGSLKLIGAIKGFNLDKDFFNNKICIDIGSSTGGFTQILLEYNASQVYAVDVGKNQFDKILLNKYKDRQKIKLFENTDIRDFVKKYNTIDNNTIIIYKEFFDIVVTDISFISLYKILSEISLLLKNDGWAILLLKPQFELDNKQQKLKYQNNKGIIKVSAQEEFYQELREKYKTYFANHNLQIINIIPSPIDGGDGNKEFLILAKKPLFFNKNTK